MISPADLLSLTKTVHSVAAGLYRAGEGMPKYRLYLALFNAAPKDPPFSDHQTDFINFLVRARILLKDEDYQVLKENIATVYSLQYTGGVLSSAASKVASNVVNRVQGIFDSKSPTQGTLEGTSASPKERIDEKNFHVFLEEAEHRYKEFSDSYEKISSKGYPTSSSTIKKQIQSPESFSNKKKPSRAPGEVSIDIYRKNIEDYLAPEKQKSKKSDEIEKEIDIEKTAITHEIDTQPIACKINEQVIHIVPRQVKKKERLKNMIESRASGATESLKKATPPSNAYFQNVNKGIKTYLVKKNIHENDKYLKASLQTVGKLQYPATLKRPFRHLPPEYGANILAIIAILSDGKDANLHITKDMSISRIVTTGQINNSYGKPPLATQLKQAKDKETIIQKINEKVNLEEANKLIATLDAMDDENLSIGAVLDNYISDVMYSDIAGKQDIESIVEFCEADATAKEYIKSTGETLASASDYLAEEAHLGQHEGIDEAEDLLVNLDIISGKRVFSPPGTEGYSSKDYSTSTSPEDDDYEYYEIVEKQNPENISTPKATPLKLFSQTLQSRITKKNEDSIKKIIKNTLAGKTKKSKEKMEKTEDTLSEASEIVEEYLDYILKQDKLKHKTTEKDAENSLQKNVLNELEIKTTQEKEEIENLKQLITETSDKLLILNKNASEIDSVKNEIKTHQENIAKKEQKYKEFLEEQRSSKDKKNLVTYKHDISDAAKLEESEKKLKKLLSERPGIELQIEETKKTITALSKEYGEKAATISANEESIDALEEKIEKYEIESPLENPEILVEEICDLMHEARTKNAEGELSETKDQTNNQNELFSHFYHALRASGEEGPSLAAYMKEYVEKNINKANSKYPLTIDTVNPPAAAASSSSTLNKLMGSSSSSASTATLPIVNVPTEPVMKKLQKTDEIELSHDILKARIQLIAKIKDLVDKKENDPKSDQTKIKDLKDALTYLTCDTHAYDHTITYHYAVASISKQPNPKDKLMFKLDEKSITNPWAEDKTPQLLKAVEEHKTKIQEKHPDCFEGASNTQKAKLNNK